MPARSSTTSWIKADGSFRLDQSYFDYGTGLSMTSPKFAALFGQPVRAPEDQMTQFHMDMAARVQKVAEEVMLRLAHWLQAETGASNLWWRSAQLRRQRQGAARCQLIEPAAGDAGGALGAALGAYYGFLNQPRSARPVLPTAMLGAYLGLPSGKLKSINAGPTSGLGLTAWTRPPCWRAPPGTSPRSARRHDSAGPGPLRYRQAQCHSLGDPGRQAVDYSARCKPCTATPI